MSTIRRWCSDEGNGDRPAEARDPRPPGRGGAGVAETTRLLRRGGSRRAGLRPRARERRPRPRPRRARTDVRAATREHADRVVRDRSPRGRVSENARPRIAVITFPGSNDDRDAAHALRLLGAEAVPVWHGEPDLPDVGAVVLPGGFSYGDYLRAGALARFAPVMEVIRAFADGGGLVLGICNGFQVLCEAGLLPGVLRPNGSLARIAGVVNAEGNVFGLMPHPEHAVDELVGSTDGALILGSLVDTVAERRATAATV